MKITNQLLKSYAEVVDPKREDLKIFSIIFKNLEGEYAYMEIITNGYDNDDCNKICLSYQGKSFFKGKFLKNPEPINAHLTRLFYIAKSADCITSATIERNAFKHVIFSDFSLPLVHPVTHEKSFITYFDQNDKPSTDLTALVLSDSLGIEIISKPIKKLRLELNAKWVQSSTGVFDIFPFIKNVFPSRNVETLTGMNFKSSFPSMGENLGHDFQSSGYSVLYANLQTTHLQKYFLDSKDGKIQIPHYTF
jgi:hypothetical protein